MAQKFANVLTPLMAAHRANTQKESERIRLEREARQRFQAEYVELQRIEREMRLGSLAQLTAEWGPALSQSVPTKPNAADIRTAEFPGVDLDNDRVSLALEAEDLLGYTPLRHEVKAPSRLQRVLTVLDIQILDKDSVGEYKIKMQKHHQAVANNESRNGRTMTIVGWKMIPLRDYKKPVPEFVLRKCTQIKREIPEATFLVDELTREERTVDPFMIVSLAGDKKTFDVDSMAYLDVWEEPEFEKTL